MGILDFGKFRIFGRAAALGVVLSLAGLAGAQPAHVYLTWDEEDTARTIVVNFQTMTDSASSEVHYDVVSHAGEGPEAYRFHTTGASHKIPDYPDARNIHWVKLTKLTPGRTYYFIAGSPEIGYSAERKFRTVSAQSVKFRFVTGGDMGPGPSPRELLEQAAKYEPAFIAVGGDISYSNEDPKNIGMWNGWLDNADRTVTPSGYMVPLSMAIGNHELKGGMGMGRPDRAPSWYGFFAQTQEGRSYFARRFGRDMLLLHLDSGHITAHAMQKDWIAEQFKANTDRPLSFAIYHVPLYPAHRDFGGMGSKMGRDLWQPIFDEYRLKFGLENHDHVYKRTKPIRANEVAEGGTVYLGDGCFGRGPRTVARENPWWIEKAGAIKHFWVIDIDGSRVEARAVDNTGRVFDVYPSDAAGATEADAYFKSIPFEIKGEELGGPKWPVGEGAAAPSPAAAAAVTN